MKKKFLFAVLCLIITGLCFANNSVPEPAFRSFQHISTPDFSIQKNQKIISINDLYSFIQEFILLKSQQTGSHGKLLQNILSCKFTQQPQIVISYSENLIFITDHNNYIEVTDEGFINQVNLFFSLLNKHLTIGNLSSEIVSARLNLNGQSFGRVHFSYRDGSQNNFPNPDPGYPFTKFSNFKTSQYIVQPGDTLWGISQKTGVSVEVLIKLNKLENTNIYPGQILILSEADPAEPIDPGNVLGYLVGSTTGDSYAAVVNQGDKLQFISPAWFWLDLNKPGIFKKDPNFGQFSDAQVKEIVDKAHSMDIKVLCLFHNLTNNPLPSKDMLHRILSEPSLREKCINDIVAKINQYNFDGVNMDFEFIHLKDKDGYSEFMRHLQNRLKPLGKLTTIAVPAKFSDTVNTWNGQFDYEKLGMYSDIVMVMTYNEHGKWSDPGPVASLPWVEKAMKYAVSKIPPEKVMMGFPSYGYDWTQNGSCRSLSCIKSVSLLNQYNAELKWHSYYASPYFEYTDSDNQKHTVWFEDRDSTEMKFMLIDKYNLNGAGMWRLGMETEDFWSLIE